MKENSKGLEKRISTRSPTRKVKSRIARSEKQLTLTERENNENKSLITDKLSAADPSVVSNKLKIVFSELFDQFEMYIVYSSYNLYLANKSF